MPNVWPNTLPQYVFQDGYSEKPGENTLESPVSSGPAKVRRIYTGKVRTLSVTMKFSATEFPIFESFHHDTLADGSLAFDWVHPKTRAPATFLFRKPHWSITAIVGTSVIVQLNLEIRS